MGVELPDYLRSAMRSARLKNVPFDNLEAAILRHVREYARGVANTIAEVCNAQIQMRDEKLASLRAYATKLRAEAASSSTLHTIAKVSVAEEIERLAHMPS